jgi:drug/metabolite transporter (DMT)-like permease
VAPIAAQRHRRGGEARLQRSDRLPLGGLVLLGGVIAPVLLILGLHRVSGVTGSLLLNLEGPFTLVVGIVAFGEHLGRRAGAAAALIVGGAIVLTVTATATSGSRGGGSTGGAATLGALAIVGACAAWGIDNNLTQRLTIRDPFAVVTVKTGIAALVNVVIAFSRGAARPDGRHLAALIVVGAIGYGASVVSDAFALRLLGAAREAAVFAVAPFAGALFAFAVLDERLSWLDLAAGTLMVAGLVMMMRDRHAHEHQHQPLEHEHRHRHDEHHRHEHPDDHPHGETDDTPGDEAHSHRHRHEPLTHVHDHVSDVHHRHPH